jgi:adenine/guanine phosphoribosyltransferase-like PRPP-binding protein
MSEKIYINHTANLVREILRQMHQDSWKPDYIVGITRGGLEPANMISQYLEIPMQALNISLRDSTMGPESNLWMAEDAFGYPRSERYIEDSNDVGAVLEAASDLLALGDGCKNILIVDDINDTGATLNWIKQDWQSGCMPDDPVWSEVWNNNVKFAVLVDNQSSEFKNIDYSGMKIDKSKDPRWIVFPWEEWWIKS